MVLVEQAVGMVAGNLDVFSQIVHNLVGYGVERLSAQTDVGTLDDDIEFLLETLLDESDGA